MPRRHENSIRGGFGRSAGPRAEPAPESAVVADRLQDPGDTVGGEDAVSHSGADDVASNGSFFLFLRFLALQHEQLCVGRQHFADGVLKLPSRLDPAAHLIGTMTGGLTAAEMRKGERAREGIGGDRETPQQLELALTQSRGERSIAPMDHLNVYIQ